ncbi:MAG: toxin HipA [Candidatus Riflebacteria bacterium HGW-Riflebacteria-2]|jgi:serine/threonine-protein kinase HipA|nr:MAG: toxin HipA [Candidatus Riflebacteria bacterium HGW-Riflebacteria-2]
MNDICLCCYQQLSLGENEYHAACLKKFFGRPTLPEMPYSQNQMLELAQRVIRSQAGVTGVQPKLSLDLEKPDTTGAAQKFTIVGLWGSFILKPPTPDYPQLPELEDLTMHLAARTGIKTVDHCLIRLKSNELAYITRRVDRMKKHKLHMEDMCQLTERLTEHKYNGSYEQIGRAVLKFSDNPGFDLLTFYEVVLFSFLTGNNDMHLKNFSLLKNRQGKYNLSPAYDLVPAALLLADDKEELALTLNARKNRLKLADFKALQRYLQIPDKSLETLLKKFTAVLPAWSAIIDASFVSNDMKMRYKDLITSRATRLGLA